MSYLLLAIIINVELPVKVLPREKKTAAGLFIIFTIDHFTPHSYICDGFNVGNDALVMVSSIVNVDASALVFEFLTAGTVTNAFSFEVGHMSIGQT